VSDTVVLVLSALLALSVPGWTGWSIWHIARHHPTRQRAATHVLSSIAGTTLLGVVLPAALKGILDPVYPWLLHAALTVAAATALGWRWPALESGKGRHPALLLASAVLLLVVAMASVAVT
jgi:hypothetical protein